MPYEIVWYDAGSVEIRETSEAPDAQSIFATWSQAKQAALASAIDNRNQWALCAREIRAMTRKEDLK